MTALTLSKALNEGLRKALENDAKVLIMGEDVGKLGGVFRVTDGLQKVHDGIEVDPHVVTIQPPVEPVPGATAAGPSALATPGNQG